MSGSEKALRLSLTASSTSADHQGLDWRLMRPKGMKDLAALRQRSKESSSIEKYSSAEEH